MAVVAGSGPGSGNKAGWIDIASKVAAGTDTHTKGSRPRAGVRHVCGVGWLGGEVVGVWMLVG
jgi:hypothetical protein